MIYLRNRHGFTLIEMIIVLFVIGALIMIIMPNLTDAGVQAQEKSCLANKKVILAQAEAYYLENGHTYPANITELVTNDYLRDEPICASDPKQKDPYQLKVQDDQLYVYCVIHDQVGEK